MNITSIVEKLKSRRFTSVGVDLQDHEIRVVVLRYWQGEIQWVNAVNLVLPEGLVIHQQVVDSQRLTSRVKDFWRVHRLPTTHLVVSVGFKEVQQHKVSINAELNSLVLLEQEVLAELEMVQSCTTEELYVDFQLLPLQDEQQKQEVHVCSVLKATCDSWLSVLNGCGLKVVALTIEPWAWLDRLAWQLRQSAELHIHHKLVLLWRYPNGNMTFFYQEPNDYHLRELKIPVAESQLSSWLEQQLILISSSPLMLGVLDQYVDQNLNTLLTELPSLFPRISLTAWAAIKEVPERVLAEADRYGLSSTLARWGVTDDAI